MVAKVIVIKFLIFCFLCKFSFENRFITKQNLPDAKHFSIDGCYNEKIVV